MGDWFRTHLVHKRGDWFNAFSRQGLSFGVPTGIALGAGSAAALQLWGNSAERANSAAWGVVIGLVAGLGVAACFGMALANHYAFTFEKDVSHPDKDTLVQRFNVTCAERQYVMASKTDDYLVYVPTLTPAVAAGPLTVSTDYLSVVVQIFERDCTIAGPRWIVDDLVGALKTVGVSEQDANADSQ
jgi:hypothetical protein